MKRLIVVTSVVLVAAVGWLAGGRVSADSADVELVAYEIRDAIVRIEEEHDAPALDTSLLHALNGVGRENIASPVLRELVDVLADSPAGAGFERPGLGAFGVDERQSALDDLGLTPDRISADPTAAASGNNDAPIKGAGMVSDRTQPLREYTEEDWKRDEDARQQEIEDHKGNPMGLRDYDEVQAEKNKGTNELDGFTAEGTALDDIFDFLTDLFGQPDPNADPTPGSTPMTPEERLILELSGLLNGGYDPKVAYPTDEQGGGSSPIVDASQTPVRSQIAPLDFVEGAEQVPDEGARELRNGDLVIDPPENDGGGSEGPQAPGGPGSPPPPPR